MITVASLHVYPVKSCRGHSVTRLRLDAFGVVGDRRFLVVDEHRSFLTQRTEPRLALIEPDMADDLNRLALRAPGQASIEVPLPGQTEATEVVEAGIWRDTVAAIDLGNTAAKWLSDFLGRPARLVTMAADHRRPMRATAATSGDHLAFQDAHPLLVIGEASLAGLCARLEAPVPMNRFRPGIVLAGAPAHAEDRWRRIRIGNTLLRASGACVRCVVTTTDQLTLERTPEPLRTLASYRRDGNGGVIFGQNYIHETKSGEMAVGDPVEILE